MPSRPSGKWTRVELFFTAPSSKEWSNIFWFKQSADVMTANFAPDAGVLQNALFTMFIPVLTTEVQMVGTQTLFNNGTGTYGVEIYVTSAGTQGTPTIPEDVSAVVQRLTATFGPSGRGRIFVAGLSATHVDGSYLNGSGILAFTTLSTALQNPIAGSVNYTPQNFSPTTGNFNPTTSWEEVSLLATNRKRRPRF